MFSTTISKTVGFRRALTAFAMLTVALAVTACKSYVFLPVDVAYEKFSPPYVMHFVNETGKPFEVLPTRYGVDAGQAKVSVPPGATFKAILQLRRFTVGKESSIPGAEVVDGPYFEQAGPDKAQVRFMQEGTHRLLVMLQDPSWFVEYQRPDAAPFELVVPLKDLSLVSLFPRGPHGGR